MIEKVGKVEKDYVEKDKKSIRYMRGMWGVVVIMYIITNKPVFIKSISLSLVGIDDEISKEDEQECVDKIKSGDMPAICVFENNTLPEEWEDGKFVTVAIDMTMRNLTIFPLQNIVAEIEETKDETRIIWTYSDEITQNLKSFSKGKVTVMWMDMYYGDMDYDEIESYVRSQSVKINYTIPPFGRQQMEVSLKNAKISKIIV